MRKIVVIGCPGSGKSFLSEKLHSASGIPLCHLDNLWWKPDGSHITREAFDRYLREILASDAWILDGDYSRTYEVRIRACDTVIFLDYAPEVCLQGIFERMGKARPDCPINSCDPELLLETERYATEKRATVTELLERYGDREIHVFRDRAESDAWLNTLQFHPEEKP